MRALQPLRRRSLYVSGASACRASGQHKTRQHTNIYDSADMHVLHTTSKRMVSTDPVCLSTAHHPLCNNKPLALLLSTELTLRGHVLPLTVIIVGLSGDGSNSSSGTQSGACTPLVKARLLGVSATGYHSMLSLANSLSCTTSGSSLMSAGSSAPPGGG